MKTTERKQTMFERIAERSQLATTYAEDGAYNRAAEILEELAKEVREHANRINRFTAPSARGQ